MAESDLDPQAFLKTVRDLSEKRQREDNERYEKLEADIVNDRNARLARRIERERSLSPEKSAPYSPRSPRSVASPTTSAPTTPKQTIPYEQDHVRGRAMSPLSVRDTSPTHERPQSPTKPSSPSAAIPSRANTMSWQRRPNSAARNRPLSVVAAENHASRSPLSGISPASPAIEEPASPLRDSARSVTLQDASVLRTSSAAGRSSPAYRRNVDDELDDGTNASRPRLQANDESPTRAKPTPPQMSSNSKETPLTRTDAVSGRRLGAPMPDTTSSPGHEPGTLGRMASMHGRTASGRPISPTKGMGGFVQSAMLKRSDSVNKRWSVQSGPGLSRENSVASVRSSALSPMNTDSPTMPKLDEHRPLISARPESFAAPKAEAMQDPEIQKSLHNRAKSMATLRDPPAVPSNLQTTFSPPLSPSKRWSPQKSSWLESALSRPESPVVAASPVTQPSWMTEINKSRLQRNGADPVPSGSLPRAPIGFDSGRATPARTPMLDPPGSTPRDILPRDPVLHQTPKATSETELSTTNGLGLIGQSPVVTSEVISGSGAPKPAGPRFVAPLSSPVRSPAVSTPLPPTDSPSKRDRSGTSSSLKSIDTAPQVEPEPEFRNALGSLRRTQTKNYVAPDVLKNNILRGKAGLATTGGPQKSARKDELKESLLKKKEDMANKSADLPPVHHRNTTPHVQSNTPEALLRRGQLGKTGNTTPTSKPAPPRRDVTPEALALLKTIKSKPAHKAPGIKPEVHPSVTKHPPTTTPQLADTSNSPRVTPRPASSVVSAKVTGRANPALAALLSRGPRADSTAVASNDETIALPAVTAPEAAGTPGDGTQLIHMTKSRAKGPKRRKPRDDSSASTSHGDTAPTASRMVSRDPDSPIDTQTPTKPAVPSQKSAAVRAASLEATKSPTNKPPTPKKSFSLPITAKSPTMSSRIGLPGLTRQTSESCAPMTDPATVASLRPARPEQVREELSLPSSPTVRPARPQPSDEDKENNDRSTVLKAAATWGRSAEKANSPPRPEPIALPQRRKEAHTVSPQVIHTESVVPPTTTSVAKPSRFLPRTGSEPASVPGKPAKSSRSISSSLRDDADKGNSSTGSTDQDTIRDRMQKHFGGIPYSAEALDIDVQSMLTPNSEGDTSVRNTKVIVQEIKADGKTTPLAAQQQHILYDNRMYIITHTFESTKCPKGAEAWLWIGHEVAPSAVEDVQIFTKRAVKAASAGRSISSVSSVHQFRETTALFQALGGIVITRQGQSSRNGINAKDSYVLCGRPYGNFYAFDEIDLANQPLCSAFTYMAVQPHESRPGKIHLWKGAGSGPEAVGSARLTAMDLHPEYEIIEHDGQQLTSEAKEVFGSHCVNLVSAPRSQPRLFRVDTPQTRRPSSALFAMFTGSRPSADNGRPSSTSSAASATSPSDKAAKVSITECIPPSQADFLDKPASVFVVDALDRILILPGPDMQTQTQSTNKQAWADTFVQGCHFGKVYALFVAEMELRPAVPQTVVLMRDNLPESVECLFRHWDRAKGVWGSKASQTRAGTSGDDAEIGVLSVDDVLRVCSAATTTR